MRAVLDSAHELLAARLGPDALAHSERVARTAVDLARIYGLDETEAALAGLLHDWDREATSDELLADATALGIALDDVTRLEPRLLHAQTGAQKARAALPELPEAVLDAMCSHTVGSPQMSELEMLIYVADMIEPGRTFSGVDDLREASGTLSLVALFAEAYRHSVMHVVRARKPLHPVTIEVWNAYCARGRS